MATRFQALGVEDGVLWRVIAFNVGVEIGQITAIVGLIGLAVVAAMTSGHHRRSLEAREAAKTGAARVVFAGLFLVASVVAPLTAYQGFTSVAGDVRDVALSDDSGCGIDERTESFPAAGGQHTEKVFYGPGERVPMEDFGHSLGDGYVIALYPTSIDSAELEQLQTVVDDADGTVLAGPHSDRASTELKVVTLDDTMTCRDVNAEALREFSATWVDSLGGG